MKDEQQAKGETFLLTRLIRGVTLCDTMLIRSLRDFYSHASYEA